MGIVYKAHDLRLDRLVAIKFLPLDVGAKEEFKHRFFHEAKAASALDHPNICNVHEIDHDENGHLFIVMAYYSGETLGERLERGALPVVEAVDIVLQVARGLDRAHAQGLVHRDVKPANIMLTGEGIVKVLDFGLAKVRDASDLTQAGTTLGTASYMSPEQTQGKPVDARSDVWSIGVVLYEALTGLRPFRGDNTPAVLYAIIEKTPEPVRSLRPEVEQGLATVVERALEKNPKERYANAGELVRDLERLSGAEARKGAVEMRR